MQAVRVAAHRGRIARRHALLAALAGAAVLAGRPRPGLAQPSFPERPITFVVPFGAGGAGDVVGRVLAERLSQRLGQPIVIETRAGGNGIIGSEVVARARPDGYTLLLATSATHAVNPATHRTLPYDPVADFEPVALVGRFPFMICVNPRLGVATPAEFIALARGRRDPLNYGYWTPSSIVAAETFSRLAGITMVGVPYRGSPAALSDLIAGRVDIMFVDVLTGRPFVQSGEVRAIAATTATRTRVLPDLAPLQEAGLGEYDISSWLGLFAPARTPPEVLARISAAVVEVLGLPEVAERLIALGFDVAPMPRDRFSDYARAELVVWRNLVQRAGIRPE